MNIFDVVISSILSFIFIILGLVIWGKNKYYWVQTSIRPKMLISEQDSTIVSKKYGLAFVLAGTCYFISLIFRIMDNGIFALIVAFIGVVSALLMVFNTASNYFK